MSDANDRSLPPQVAQHSIDANSSTYEGSVPERPVSDDTLVWVLERRRNMTAHLTRPPLPDRITGEWLRWGDARRAYSARTCGVCWPTGGDSDVAG